MTIILSHADYWKLLNQAEPIQQHGYADEFDITYKHPLAKGYFRRIQIRGCIFLDIYNCQLNQLMIVDCPDRGHWFEVRFSVLADSPFTQNIPLKTGEYFLRGIGMAPAITHLEPDLFRAITVCIHISPKVFCAFAGDESGEILRDLQHLVRPLDRVIYERIGNQTPAMQIALQQILRCPYKGMTKRMYLESKVWELAALLVEQELETHQSSLERNPLRASDIDCIHHAKEILLTNLDNPPSLIELARQVRINDYKLKLGFRTVFGTTVFGYLHDHRMKLAHKLLIQGNMKITEVAQTVGYTSLPSFSNAFRKKFGVSPRACHG